MSERETDPVSIPGSAGSALDATALDASAPEAKTANANETIESELRELKAAHNDLTNLLRSTDIAVLFLDRDFRVRRFTAAIEKFFDLRSTDVGRPISEIVETFPDGQLLADARRVLQTLEPVESETTDESLENSFLRTIRPYRTEDDRIDGVVVTYTDISKRKKFEKALTASEEVFRTLFDRAAVGIAQVSTEGRFLRVNAAFCRMYGYTEEELSRLTFHDVSHPDDLPATEKQAHRLRDGAANMFSMEKRSIRKSGEVMWIRLSVTAVRDERGELRYFDAIVEDISRRHQAEEQLQRLMADLERQVERRTWTVQLLQENAVIANESDTVEEAFERALDRVCLQLEWPVGHVILPKPDAPEVFVDSNIWSTENSDRFEPFIESSRTLEHRAGDGFIGRVIETGRPQTIANVLEDKSFVRGPAMRGCDIRGGFAFPVLVRERVVGVMEFYACEESDLEPELIEGLAEIGTQLGRVVERKELHQGLADATAREQQVLGQELHDSVAQKLTALSMFAERLRKDLESEGHDTEPRAGEIVEQITGLQNQVRQISHGLMPVEIDPRGLMAALQKLADSSEAFYGVKCEFACPSPVSVAHRLAANQLYRIAQEAVHNAARHGEPTQITIRLNCHDGTATLSVTDNGKGFAGEPKDVAGIGFRIMRHRAGLFRGKLKMTSRPGEGTTVACTFRTKN